MTRTQEEILARFNAVDSFFGYEREILAEAMDVQTLAAVGIDATALADWRQLTHADLEAAAESYLEFAIGKIEEHRGLSADRSVTKLREYAWLLGRDDVVEAMDATGYAQYGAPKVRVFARKFGWPWPDSASLNRMAAGASCRIDCEDGCGR